MGGFLLNPYVFGSSVPSGSIIESIQAFSIVINGTSNTATINSVNTATSIVIMNGFSSPDNATTYLYSKFCKVVLTNSTTVTASVGVNTFTDLVTVKGYVIEFKSNVIQSVQTGDIIIPAGGSTTADAAISEVILENSAIINAGGTMPTGTANINSLTTVATTLEATSTISIRATRGVSDTNAATTVRYYIVEFVPDYIVSRNQIVATSNQIIPAVDLNKTILFNAGFRADGNQGSNIEATYMSSSTLVGVTGSTAAAQVLEFVTGIASVQSGSITIGSGQISNIAVISSVDVSKSIVILSGNRGNDSLNSSIGSAYFSNIALTNSVTVTAVRGQVSAASTTAYFMVVTFT